MSLALVMMVPLKDMSGGASFAAAFTYVGLDWARYIVALGALLGIITGARWSVSAAGSCVTLQSGCLCAARHQHTVCLCVCFST